jgi:hypothetical protein
VKLPFELQSQESVLLLARRHWMYLYPKLILQALFGLLPIVLLTTIAGIGPGLSGGPGAIVLILDVLWAGYWAIRIYFTWYRYNNDVWVVTNQRIVDSLRRHWFHHRMASADLIDVEDIAVHREGPLPTMFNFGDLRCQTAGTEPNFILAGIPNPAAVLSQVDAARDAARQQRVAAVWDR